MKLKSIVVLICFLSSVRTQIDFPNLPESTRKAINKHYIKFRKTMHDVLAPRASMKDQARSLSKENKIQEVIDEDVPFPCDVSFSRSPQVPESVHRIRPGDIKVIGALGDSLTAAYGAFATNPLLVLRENRGVAALMGGQGTWREFLTLPNILKNFNPDLIGFSLGDSVATEWNSQFNVAEGGASKLDLPFMAKELIYRLKNDTRVDIENDWKLVSILMGANDYCSDICYKEVNFLERRRQILIETLDILKENLPRTIVNLVISPDVGLIFSKFRGPYYCWIFHTLSCPCIKGSAFAKKRTHYMKLIAKGIDMDYKVADLSKYDREDFTVVAQPTLTASFPLTAKGEYDVSYLSFDCFHISQKGQAEASVSVWNNLLQPVGQKSRILFLNINNIVCPTKDRPYIFTRRNSNNTV